MNLFFLSFLELLRDSNPRKDRKRIFADFSINETWFLQRAYIFFVNWHRLTGILWQFLASWTRVTTLTKFAYFLSTISAHSFPPRSHSFNSENFVFCHFKRQSYPLTMPSFLSYNMAEGCSELETSRQYSTSTPSLPVSRPNLKWYSQTW